MKQQPILKVSGLSKVYPSGNTPLTVFSGLNFEAAAGEVIAFLGPSGCGKSTLLECIAGLTDCTGDIELEGKKPKAAVSQKKIGLAFQEAALIDWLTAAENILLPSHIGKRLLSGDKAAERLEVLLKLMGLESFRNFYPAQLSGGMKQRTALARSLMHTPKLLLLDEPFSSLDSLTRLRIMIEFKSVLNKEKTCTILITHSMEEAAYLADRIFILSPLPAEILYEIPVKYHHPRNADLLDLEEFNDVIIQCRKKLLNYAQ